MTGKSQTCDLCGLPVPEKGYPFRAGDRALLFCCEGCREIWRMLNDVKPKEKSS